MLLASRVDLRKKPRQVLTGLMPGNMTIASTEKKINARPIDVSPQGLGILIETKLDLDTILVLNYRGSSIEMKVIWSQPDLSRHTRFRYGLKVIDSKYDLCDIFKQTGCLKTLESFSK